MTTFDYAPHPVRDVIVAQHRSSWQRIAAPGSHFSGRERVEIARQARATRAARGDPPWLRNGLPDAGGVLSDDAVDAARTIAADAHKIDVAWAQKRIDALGDAAYVELGSVVATVTTIDAFCEALGRDHEPLPEPAAGEPDGARLTEAADAGAFVPMAVPWKGPNVGRAMSLVPDANAMFMGNVMVMYSSASGSFYDMVWNGPLTRPQAELLAARVSALSECFY